MTPATRTIAFFAALSLLTAASAELRSNLDLRNQPTTTADEPIYLPKAEYLRPLSLGYHNVLADVLWFRAISYFGEHYRSDRTYRWLAHICELVTDLDPRAEHVYRFAGLILPWEAGDVDGGIRMLEKGVQALPRSWTLSYYLGFTYFFFKDDYETAALHLQRAASLPDVHPAVTRLASTLTTEVAGPETTMAFLRDLEQNVDSKQVRDVLQRNLQETAAATAITTLNAAIDDYRARLGEPPKSLEQLVAAGFLRQIPRDPFGGRFYIDQDGSARSSTGEGPPKAHTSPLRKRAIAGTSGRELLN